MSVRFNIADVVSVVEETLSSIDIRTASVRIDGKWLNVITVVRLSSDSPAVASAGVQEIWRKHGAVRTEEFRIDYQVLPFEDWDPLLAALTKGQLRFSEAEIEFGRSVDIPGSLGYIQSRFCALLPQPDWPMLEISVNTTSIQDASKNPQYRINGEHIQRAVSKLGYSGAFEAMTGLLGLKISQGSLGFDVFIAVPVMAKINEPVVCPRDGIIRATVTCHPALVSFRVFGSCHGASGEGREKFSFESDSTGQNDGRRQFIARAHRAISETKEYLELRLVHDELGEVFSHSWRTRDLIPEQYVNPLYFLLTRFCSPTRLQSLLVRPHAVPIQKTKPQKEFEQHVAWLLGCYGFATIVLGAHEDLIAEHTKVKRGSVDLLAYHPARKVVLLAGCTLNVPKEEDYAQLVSVRSMLLEDWKGDVPFACDLAMFTGVPDCAVASYSMILDPFTSIPNRNSVTVIDANALSDALVLLQERKEEQFLKRFSYMELP